jgi:hypothetical protein
MATLNLRLHLWRPETSSVRPRVLPGFPRGGEDLADPHTRDSSHELLPVDRVAIPKQGAWSRIVREGLDELQTAEGWSVTLTWRSSRRSWRSTTKTNRRRRSGLARGRSRWRRCLGHEWRERPATWRGSRRGPVHVLGHGQLGDSVAEQSEFALDAVASPRWLDRHDSHPWKPRDRPASLLQDPPPTRPLPGGVRAPPIARPPGEDPPQPPRGRP